MHTRAWSRGHRGGLRPHFYPFSEVGENRGIFEARKMLLRRSSDALRRILTLLRRAFMLIRHAKTFFVSKTHFDVYKTQDIRVQCSCIACFIK